jgi:hypothetical protein
MKIPYLLLTLVGLAISFAQGWNLEQVKNLLRIGVARSEESNEKRRVAERLS